ncbi:hypothetical protein BpHYR1_015583 [Brachionus plicatilis]|uniref:Uncharacterized protein n=1 Tax=Brachionus plicatilis TaxID=10195 RepID=A0A3M7Q0J6_BRAPC|nr:hypothetical protein BpHYR1_015583 [Brachionus plicatilis]
MFCHQSMRHIHFFERSIILVINLYIYSIYLFICDEDKRIFVKIVVLIKSKKSLLKIVLMFYINCRNPTEIFILTSDTLARINSGKCLYVLNLQLLYKLYLISYGNNFIKFHNSMARHGFICIIDKEGKNISFNKV